jgi:glyoxylase-like metal-dependent hydrolase (beta-lactamase superfamily II)
MAVVIPYVRDLDVQYGRVEQVSPLVRRVIASNANKFTYKGTGTYLVGRGEVAVIDAGPALPEHVEAILSALEPGERITHLLVTHTHSDHSPATALVQANVDAASYGFGPHGAVPPDDPDDRVVFGDPDADGETEKAEQAKAIAEGRSPDELREGADTDFRPDIALADGDVVCGAGWTLRAVHTPGHTSNHLCFALDEEAALFSGDHVMGWSTSVIGPPDGNLGQYLASLRKLLARPDERYWPTHGPVIGHPHELVRSFLAHRAERTEQLLAALADGPATLVQLVPRLYAPATPKPLWRAAAASLYAHVLDQIERGTVASDGEPKRSAVFRLA